MFFLDFFVYLRESRKRENMSGGGAEGEGVREADSLLSSEPSVGLDPRTPES